MGTAGSRGQLARIWLGTVLSRLRFESGHLALPSKLSVGRKREKKKENSSQLRELIQIISEFLHEARLADSHLISAIVEGITVDGRKLLPDTLLPPLALNQASNAV